MQFTQRQNVRTRLCFLLMLLILLQTAGVSFVMAAYDYQTSTTDALSSTDMDTYAQSEQRPDHCGNGSTQVGGDQHSLDCCAAACCPVVTSASTLDVGITKNVLPLELIASFTPITLLIEVKPPRLVTAI